MPKIYKISPKLSTGPDAPSVIDLPTGSVLLTSGLQFPKGDPELVVWYEHANSPKNARVEFCCIGTGLEAPPAAEGWVYLGTVQFDAGGTEIVQHQYFRGVGISKKA